MPVAEQKLQELWDRRESVTTTPINAAELFKGAYRVSDSEREVRRVKGILAVARIVDLPVEACERYGKLVGNLQSKGDAIGDLDTLIASIAITHNQALLTRNKSHFEKIPGLILESY
jgi:tRNA(fMet)-specific endonuclease VapC